MNISKDIITDLLPIYYSGECSQDTKSLVEEYLRGNPDFERQARNLSQNPLPEHIPQRLGKNDEIRSLAKAKRSLRLRGSVMALAIFFSLAPFSVFHVDGKTHWLLLESPLSACLYGGVGVCLWVAYFVMRRKTKIL